MGNQTDEQKRYHSNPASTEDLRVETERKAKAIEPHEGENKVTTSTEGKVETTTHEKKA